MRASRSRRWRWWLAASRSTCRWQGCSIWTKEQARLADEIAKAQALVERSRRMLDNPDFVARAKPEVVQKERDALAAAQDTVARLEARRKELSA